VARRTSCSTAATRVFRGLKELLRLPWANATTPAAAAGTVSEPDKLAPSAGITTWRRTIDAVACGASSCRPIVTSANP
jgi:hypothetical protein